MPPPPLVKFLTTPLPALVVGENIWLLVLGPPHFRNASAIAGFAPTLNTLCSELPILTVGAAHLTQVLILPVGYLCLHKC